MPKSPVLPVALDPDLDLDHLVRAIAADAAPALASSLHSAGSRYEWEEIVPELVRRLLEAAVAGEPSVHDRRRVVDVARRCARDWVPLQELEHCCQIVLTVLFRHLWNVARPRAAQDLLGISAGAAQILPRVTTMLRRAYIDEMGRTGGRTVADLVVTTLWNGGDVASVARVAGTGMPGSCVLAALSPVVPPDETDAEPVRFGAVPPGVLGQLPAGGMCAASPDREWLIALLPAPHDEDPESRPAVRNAAIRLVAACHAAYGRGFVAGLAAVTRDDAKAAIEEAIGIGGLLASLGEHDQVAFLTDAAVGVALAGRGDLRHRLESRLSVVRSHEQLWETLRTLYRSDLDRGRTARSLGIHRSTLDYRLSRVEALAGVSPTSVQGILLYSAGLYSAELGDDDPAL
ncbi:PucR family transcriptional regulator [Actinomadura rudentiformis]|uniref:PucR family transcriptional regulator n=1 Tax=Actinomadura rudentiformis TaxID=359158 RepID=A0A6H9YML5_9ACTN|nr:PucR family transcriptional regulator [Actinomadura rudentiformis]KAB2341632.1 PucR family transcriptional regulator [Actinomadura rudentiformis]